MPSPNFEKVKDYYVRGLWSEERVNKAIDRWITQEEADEILTPVTEENEDNVGIE